MSAPAPSVDSQSPSSLPISSTSSDPLDILENPEVRQALDERAAALPTQPVKVEGYLESMALLAQRAPEHQAEEVAPHIDSSQFDALSAISLESHNDERAENFKQSGNEAFKLAAATKARLAKELEKPEDQQDKEAIDKLTKAVRKRYDDAYNYYCHGIAVNAESKRLTSQLWANRAQIQIILENYGHALKDCDEAIRLDPNNSKAYWRACQSCMKTGKLARALEYCRQGPKCKYIQKIEIKSFAGLEKEIVDKLQAEEAAAMEKARKAAEAAEGEAVKKRRLETAIANRGLTMGKPMFNVPGAEGPSASFGLNHSIYTAQALLNADHTLSWPLLFLYPQVQQSDFVQKAHEHDRLIDHIAPMFPPLGQSPPWDPEGRFRTDRLRVFIEIDPQQTKSDKHRLRVEEELKKAGSIKSDEGKLMIPVDTSQSVAVLLGSAPLKKRGYTIPAVPTFTIIAQTE